MDWEHPQKTLLSLRLTGRKRSDHIFLGSACLTVEQTLYAADILFLAGHCAAKMSVCLLLRRLGRETPYWKLCRAILVFISFWGVASVLVISLRCDLRRPWDLEQQCMHVVSITVS